MSQTRTNEERPSAPAPKITKPRYIAPKRRPRNYTPGHQAGVNHSFDVRGDAPSWLDGLTEFSTLSNDEL